MGLRSDTREALAVALLVFAIRMQHPKCLLRISPEVARLLGEPQLLLVSLDPKGRLVRSAVTTVGRP